MEGWDKIKIFGFKEGLFLFFCESVKEDIIFIERERDSGYYVSEM